MKITFEGESLHEIEQRIEAFKRAREHWRRGERVNRDQVWNGWLRLERMLHNTWIEDKREDRT